MKSMFQLVGLDSILLITFVFLNIMTGKTIPDLNTSLLVTTTIIYVVSDFANFLFVKKMFYYIKLVCLLLVIVFLVAIPMLNNINIRRTSVNYLFIHDGALQTEIAVRFLIKGINPYSATYFGTPLAQWPYHDPENPADINPALYHFAYLPFSIERAAVGQAIQKQLLGWVDIRFTIFAEYLGMLLIVFLLTKNLSNKFSFLVLFALNPLVTHFILEGRNDMSAFFYLLCSLFLLVRKKFILSAVFLAFALTFKQTLWLIGPLVLLYVYLNKSTKNKFVSYLVAFIAIFSLIMAPFFIWQPKSFIDSTISYFSGNTTHSYPIKSIGFARILLLTNLIKNQHSSFPFWILQLFTAGPIYYFVIKKMPKYLRLSYVLLSFGVIESVFLYFSRIFSDNYFTLVYLIFISAYLFYQREKAEVSRAKSEKSPLLI